MGYGITEVKLDDFNLSFLFCFAAKFLPVGYGIKKLQINAVIEDDKVSTDDLEEKITEFEDYVSTIPA